ncbi:hypothetical protein M569_03228 [Genlisea aurea]|uniref:ACT domain-containing protein n=1 Tax=Genlisea aurea TaxID=192259 RepID=S8CVV3_9LAMI|nr:hypothetical protein M569_03228 [Genlisea aurea]
MEDENSSGNHRQAERRRRKLIPMSDKGQGKPWIWCEDRAESIRVSICCEDRADLFGNLNAEVKSLGLIVEAGEVTGVGGRMRSSFLLRSEQQQKQDPSLFNQSLKSKLNRLVFISSVSDKNHIAGSRFFQ